MDEATDKRGVQQLPLCCVNQNENEYEQFLLFVPEPDVSGEGLASASRNYLTHLCLASYM